MPLLPDLAEECGLLVVTPQELCITLPGAVDVCVQIPDIGFPDPIEMVKQLFAQFNAALTPLAPIFNILDVVITLINCVKAIPDGPTEFPPFKTLATECIPQLPAKLAKLLALIPPLSLPITILGFIDALIVLFDGFLSFLNRVINNLQRIVEAETRAAILGSRSLDLVVDCANANAELEMEQFNEGLGPLSNIIALVGIFAGLAGLDISGASLSGGPDPSALIDPLNSALDTIKQIRNTIPV